MCLSEIIAASLLSLRARIVLVATPAEALMQVTTTEIGKLERRIGIQLDALSKDTTNE
jgi:hypothetical protein